MYVINQFILCQVMGKNIPTIVRINFGVAVMINFLLLVSLRTDTQATEVIHFTSKWSDVLVRLLGFVQMMLSVLVLAFCLLKRAPLKVIEHRRHISHHHHQEQQYIGAGAGARARAATEFKEWLAELMRSVFLPVMKVQSALLVLSFFIYSRDFKEHWLIWSAMLMVIPQTMVKLRGFWGNRRTRLTQIGFLYVCFYDSIFNAETLFRVLHALFSLLGLFSAPWFYAFHLFEVIVMSPTLTNVVRAVWVPSIQLGMTAILALIVLYAFTLIEFFFFRDSFHDGNAYDENHCTDLYSCFLFTMHVGLLSGGGIGEYITFELEQVPGTPGLPSTARLLFDICFFVCITIGLLNIVFGIMIGL